MALHATRMPYGPRLCVATLIIVDATQLHLMWRSAPGEGVLGKGAGSCRAAALLRSSAATRCSALSAARPALRTWEARSWTKPLLSRRTSSNSAADALSFSVTRPCKVQCHSWQPENCTCWNEEGNLKGLVCC